jgi:hypothetical protein
MCIRYGIIDLPSLQKTLQISDPPNLTNMQEGTRPQATNMQHILWNHLVSTLLEMFCIYPFQRLLQ